MLTVKREIEREFVVKNNIGCHHGTLESCDSYWSGQIKIKHIIYKPNGSATLLSLKSV